MKTSLLVLILSATAALASDAPRPIFPSDYKPHPCAPTNSCVTFTTVSYSDAAAKFLYRTADVAWANAHRDELLAMIQPYCTKRATCMATPGNDWMFCNDVFLQELRGSCQGLYPKEKDQHSSEQCRLFVDVYAAGVDQHGSTDWKAAQKCSADAASSTTRPVQHMEWWSVPSTVPLGHSGSVEIFAINTETHVPVQAVIAYEGLTLYSKDTPSGRLQTYYQIPVPSKLVRVPNASGHDDVVPPAMTLSAPGYETITARAPVAVGSIKASVQPDLSRAPRGKRSKIAVTTIDEKSGAAVEMVVMLGNDRLGMSNKTLEVTLPKRGPVPDLWVTSPFDAYSDVVVLPARK